jgi:TRAP-type C4-dicarboxylate transport system permease small subunit
MKYSGNRLLSRTESVIEGLAEFTGYLCGFFILAASIIIADAVFMRKVLGQSTSWQSELSVYLLMASAFIGAVYTQKHDGHIGVDLVTAHLQAKSRRIIDIAGSVVGFVVTVVIARYAWPKWWMAIEANEHSESYWGPHLGFPYSFIPLGMTLLALLYLIRIRRKIAQFRAPGPPHSISTAPPSPADKETA